jgi:hypothetical protein
MYANASAGLADSFADTESAMIQGIGDQMRGR